MLVSAPTTVNSRMSHESPSRNMNPARSTSSLQVFFGWHCGHSNYSHHGLWNLIFISSSYDWLLNLKSINKTKSTFKEMKRCTMSLKDTCKLLVLLAGFMFLLGLSWLILLFTVVGADTNIYAAFAIQWLFVFFNSLQGFFLFVFFVALNRDARKLWLGCFCSSRRNRSSTKFKYNSTSAEKTTSTKLAEYSDSDMKRNHTQSETTTTSVHLETIINNTSPVKHKTSKRPRWSLQLSTVEVTSDKEHTFPFFYTHYM